MTHVSGKSIEITVSPQGDTTLETRGFAGQSCREASEFIEKALGPRTGEQLTPEFYQSVPQREQARQR